MHKLKFSTHYDFYKSDSNVIIKYRQHSKEYEGHSETNAIRGFSWNFVMLAIKN